MTLHEHSTCWTWKVKRASSRQLSNPVAHSIMEAGKLSEHQKFEEETQEPDEQSGEEEEEEEHCLPREETMPPAGSHRLVKKVSAGQRR